MSNFVPQLAAEAPNATEYIAHHLTFLTNHPPQGLADFSVVNYDTVFFSVLLAAKASSRLGQRPEPDRFARS